MIARARTDAGPRLDADALALEADTTRERVERLAAVGAIRPDEYGQFGRGDVIRSRLLARWPCSRSAAAY